MTFYEAAIQILLREGRPLHAHEITQRALEENLLSHVGKQPEVVMASQLAAMARRSQDRRIVAVAPDTFGLADWNLANDPAALEASGIPPVPEEASQPPLRERERHPKISKDNVRIMGRVDRRRREEARKRRRKAKTLPEIVEAILGHAGVPLPLFDLAAAIRAADLVQDDLGGAALRQRLVEENEQQAQELFVFFDEDRVGLPGMEAAAAPADAESLIAEALEKVVRPKARPEPQVQAPTPAEPEAPAPEDWEAQSRQLAVRQIRARLQELSVENLEGLASTLLQEMGYREVRLAKKHKEGGLIVAKRRMGLLEVRQVVRVLRGAREVRRDDVLDLRKEMAAHSALLGVLVSPGDPTREARNEALRPGQGLVLLLCADALAEQLVERGIGVAARTVTLVQFDPRGLAARIRRGHRSLAGRAEAEARKEERESRKARGQGGAEEKRPSAAAVREEAVPAASSEVQAEDAPPAEPRREAEADADLEARGAGEREDLKESEVSREVDAPSREEAAPAEPAQEVVVATSAASASEAPMEVQGNGAKRVDVPAVGDRPADREEGEA